MQIHAYDLLLFLLLLPCISKLHVTDHMHVVGDKQHEEELLLPGVLVHAARLAVHARPKVYVPELSRTGSAAAMTAPSDQLVAEKKLRHPQGASVTKPLPPLIAERPAGKNDAFLVGSASTSRTVMVDEAAEGADYSLAAYLQSSESNPSLLNAANYKELGSGIYECTVRQINVGGFKVTPILNINISRDAGAESLLFRVLNCSLNVKLPYAKEPRVVEGANIESCVRVGWAREEGERVQLRSEVAHRVGLQLPNSRLVSRRAVERVGSLAMRYMSEKQCSGILGDIEDGWRAWRASKAL